MEKTKINTNKKKFDDFVKKRTILPIPLTDHVKT